MKNFVINIFKKPMPFAILCSVLVFCLITLSLFFSHSTVDPDTMTYLIRYANRDYGPVTRPLWNVHMIYGLYINVFSLFSNHFTAPVIVLSAIGFIVILLSAYRIFMNHVSDQKARWGLVFLFLIPGFHLLAFRMEDNLPYLASIVLLVAALDTMCTKRMSIWGSLLAGVSLAVAILFHTMAIMFVFLPVLMLLSREHFRERWKYALLIYGFTAGFLCLFLAVIPWGFAYFINAYRAQWGIADRLRFLLKDSASALAVMKEEFIYYFRIFLTIPANISKIGSSLVKWAYITAIVVTHLLFYGWAVAGVIRMIRKRRANIFLLAMIAVGVILPILLTSFTIERMDHLIFFLALTGFIGIFEVSEKKEAGKGFRYGLVALCIVFVCWDILLYAQCTRWIHKPPEYRQIIHLLKQNTVEESEDGGFLFLDEESLYKNIEYFVVIRRYPRMRHFGIEANGQIYRVLDAWGFDKPVLDEAEVKEQFLSTPKNYITPSAWKRFTEFYGKEPRGERLRMD